MTEKEFNELEPGDKVKIVDERPERNWLIWDSDVEAE